MGLPVATVIAYACAVSTVHQSIAPPFPRHNHTPHILTTLRLLFYSFFRRFVSKLIFIRGITLPSLARSDWHHMARQKSGRSQSTKLIQSRLNTNLFKPGASPSKKASKDKDKDQDKGDKDEALHIALTQSLETHSRSRGQDRHQLTLDDEEQDSDNFGGKDVQITDPWLSGDNIHQDRSRLTRPRQPIALLSTATSRDDSPSTSSPRRYAPEQVSSSDHDESCSEPIITRDSRNRRPRSSPSRKPANISSRSEPIDISSSDDDVRPYFSSRRRSRSTVEVIESSDDSMDELAKDISRNAFYTRRRNYPVADDTIASRSREGSEVAALGSSSKMPWSINEGPKTDIVLSTPQAKRVHHYTMVQDSEEESDSITSNELWSRSGRKPAVAAKHLDLPNIEATDETKRLSSRPLVSDSQPEHDDFEDPPGSAESLSKDTSPLLPFSSQELYTAPVRVPRSPTQRKGNLRPLLSLTKPKPLVLDVPSDIEFTQDTPEQEMPNKQDAEAEHRRLREELFSDSIEDDSQPLESSTKVNPSTNRMVIKRKQRSFEDSPFAAFPMFSRATRRSAASSDDDDDPFRRDTPSRANRSERPGATRDSVEPVEEEEEEALIDRRRFGRDLLSSPSKRAKFGQEPSLQDRRNTPSKTSPTLRPRDSPLPRFGASPSVMSKESPSTRVRGSLVQSAMSPAPPLRRLETIESISTFTDSQPGSTQTRPTPRANTSQPEEIGYFTDDEPIMQQEPARKERKNRRYSGLEFADRSAIQDLSREKSSEVQFNGKGNGASSSAQASRIERCILCSKMIPAADLEAHVAQELDQQERERQQKEDEEMALALDKQYQTQDTYEEDSVADRTRLLTRYPVGGRTLGESLTSPQNKGRAGGGVSLDTPTRKVGNMSLESPFSLRTTKKFAAGSNFQATIRKAGSIGISSDEYGSQVIDNEPIDLLSQNDSSSSQNVFRIQPGQDERGSAKSSKMPSAPMVIRDDKPKNDDDDMDDFVMPEPASMFNKSFRTKIKKAGDNTPTLKPTSRPTNKKTIDLDDSEDDIIEVLGARSTSSEIKQTTSRTTTNKDKGKSKFSVLDSVLPESARLQRNKKLGRAIPNDNDPHQWDDFSSSVTQRPMAEKLWKPEDDDFEADNMDQRQVRGIGLGGVIGGVGAIPGSLNTSKVTRHAAESQKAQQEAEEQAQLQQQQQQQQRPVLDDPFSHMPSFEYEDPNYGLASQEWMKSPTPERRKLRQQLPREDDGFGYGGVDYGDGHQDLGDGGEEDDDGYESPFDDLVDLRQRRDDPAMAMFFNQFEPSVKKKGGSGSRGKTRGSGSKSTKKSGGGVTYAAGVQQIGNDGSSSKNSFGRSVSFDAPTTSNGSMAVNSKATPAYGRGRGRGKKSSGAKYYRGRGGRGRGRGRGGGGGGGGLGFDF